MEQVSRARRAGGRLAGDAGRWHRAVVRSRCRYFRQRTPRCRWTPVLRMLRVVMGARPTSAAAGAS